MAQSARALAPRSTISSPDQAAPEAPGLGAEGGQIGQNGLGNAERTRRRLGAVDDQYPSLGHAGSSGEDEAGICRDVDGVGGNSRRRIETFRDRLIAALRPWQAQRMTTDLVFDVAELNGIAADFLRSWQANEGSLPADLIRDVLDVGTVRSSLIEIATFSWHLSGNYGEWLQFGALDFVPHTYTLTPHTGIMASEIITGRLVPCTLTYQNSHGMRWSVEGVLAMVGARAAAGMQGGFAGYGPTGSAAGVELVPAGTAITAQPTRNYFSPEDFGASEAYTIEAEAMGEGAATNRSGGGRAMGAGYSFTGLALCANGRTLNFLSSGFNVTQGLSQAVQPGPPDATFAGRVGFGAALGTVIGEAPAVANSQDIQPLEEASRGAAPDPEVHASATVYFNTGDASLDGDDVATLQDLVERMGRISDRFRQTVPHVQITGWASRQWRAARGPEDAAARNDALADRRAQVVRRSLDGMYGDPDARYDTMVRQLQETEVDHYVQAPQEEDQNNGMYRAVSVLVTFHPCRRDEHAESWRL